CIQALEFPPFTF
nr:immunoglobulin light chain junction region [Macaca mulatta]MOY00731.1 immunoglobulin light chain junction region [Macaca mulatta]MOY02822.1 immunoglobulin light chain junction region [Macaca mulatta]